MFPFRFPSLRLRAWTACLLCTGSLAWAQGDTLGPTLIERYGGTLSGDCRDPLAPQLEVRDDALVVHERGWPLVTGRDVKAAPTFFNAVPPPGFEMALTSRMADGEMLAFVFLREGDRLYATVVGSPKVLATLPASLKDQRVPHCDPRRNVAPPPAEAPAEPPGPWDLLKDAAFREPYLHALGALADEPWIAQLRGPAPPMRPVQVDGTDYRLIAVCKAHDCDANNLVLLWSEATHTVYGQIFQHGRATTRIGTPSAPVAAELDRLWQAEWRGGK